MKTSYIYTAVLTSLLLASGGLAFAGGGFDDFSGTSDSSQSGQTTKTIRTSGNTGANSNSTLGATQDDSGITSSENDAQPIISDKRVWVLGGATVVLLAWLGYWFWKRNQPTPTV